MNRQPGTRHHLADVWAGLSLNLKLPSNLEKVCSSSIFILPSLSLLRQELMDPKSLLEGSPKNGSLIKKLALFWSMLFVYVVSVQSIKLGPNNIFKKSFVVSIMH